MERFRVGVVGAGTVARNAHLPVLASMPDVEIAWLGDTNPVTCQAMAAAQGVRAWHAADPANLPECDVVLLAIPLQARARYYEICAARGIAVFVEKPFALNYLEHRAIQARFEPYAVGCGFQRRMHVGIRFLRSAVLQNWFGRLKKISIREGGRTRATGQDSSYQNLSPGDGGGILLNLGCHGLDAALFIVDARSATVMRSEVEMDGPTDRKAQAGIRLEGAGAASEGCDFEFCVSWVDEQPNEIVAEFETLSFATGTAPSSRLICRPKNSNFAAATFEPADTEGARTINQAFYLEWRAFLSGLRRREPSIMAAQTAERTTRLIDDLLSSPKRDCSP